jgi:tetratricopeptide (TPR) repeat protein
MNAFRLGMALLLASTCLPTPGLAASQSDYQALKIWCIERDQWNRGGRVTPFPNVANYEHYHHYCSAVDAINKEMFAKDKQKQKFHLGEVMNNTDYVISHVAPTHNLLPEVYALRGKALAMAHHNAEAERDLLKALLMDPTHLEALFTLAQLYADTRRQDAATKTVLAGLAIAPDNKRLRRLGKTLGVKLPEDKPLSDTTQSSPAKESVPVDPPPAQDGVVVVPAETARVAEPAEIVDEPKIGTPSNPWCRFCPEVAGSSSDHAPSSSATTSKVGP